jgi:hypothetical protein
MNLVKNGEYKVNNKVFLHTTSVVYRNSLCFQAHFHIDFGQWWEVSGGLHFLCVGISFTFDGDDYAYNYTKENTNGN